MCLEMVVERREKDAEEEQQEEQEAETGWRSLSIARSTALVLNAIPLLIDPFSYRAVPKYIEPFSPK